MAERAGTNGKPDDTLRKQPHQQQPDGPIGHLDEAVVVLEQAAPAADDEVWFACPIQHADEPPPAAPERNDVQASFVSFRTGADESDLDVRNQATQAFAGCRYDREIPDVAVGIPRQDENLLGDGTVLVRKSRNLDDFCCRNCRETDVRIPCAASQHFPESGSPSRNILADFVAYFALQPCAVISTCNKIPGSGTQLLDDVRHYSGIFDLDLKVISFGHPAIMDRIAGEVGER